MRKLVFPLLSFALFLWLSSCRYNNLEDLLKPDCDTCQAIICDTSFTISYANDIRTITAEYCDKCHSATNGPVFGDGNVFDNYTTLSEYAGNGKLLCAIKHEADCVPMPEDDPKLSDCNIARIEAWVRQGHPDN